MQYLFYMQVKKWFLLITGIFYSAFLLAQENPLLFHNSKNVSNMLTLLREDPSKKAAASELLKKGRSNLSKSLTSVVAKQQTTPCGNPHEYMSMAAYFWPDPTKPDGLPYIRKDGQRNPENAKVPDHKSMDDWISWVTSLSWSYYLSKDEVFAQKAVGFLRFWCIDTATYMIPNLNHAQIIRGIDTGRGIGIIDIHQLPDLLEGLQLLESSAAFTVNDRQLVKQWFRDLLYWLRNSDNGKQEMRSKNNHKTFYEGLVASLAIYVGEYAVADEIFAKAPQLMLSQIMEDGLQPLETERTNGLSYSIFNLVAWFQLATLAENRGVDLWNFPSAANPRIKKALDILLPYVSGEKKWITQQIGPFQPEDYYRLTDKAAFKYNNSAYKGLGLAKQTTSIPIHNLFYR